MSTKKVSALECRCERCGAVWTARGDPPVRCAKCRSPYWNKPKTR